MTSVPNHQRLLNGNKALSFISIFLLILSCGVGKNTVKSTPVVVQEPDTIKVVSKNQGKKTVKDHKVDSLDIVYPEVKKQQYKVAFLLPLFSKTYPNAGKSNNKIADIALDYLWGAQIALDTLKLMGLNAHISVFDTENDSAKMVALREKIRIQNYDLVIGPLFAGNLKYLEDVLRKKKINVVSPLSNVAQIDSFNTHIFYTQPSPNLILQKSAEFILTNYPSRYPIEIIAGDKEIEKSQAETIVKFLGDKAKSRITRINPEGQYVQRSTVQTKIQDSAIIFIASESESFVTSVMAEIVRAQKTVFVIGREKWLDYQSIDAELCQKLGMHFILSKKIDYELPVTQWFVSKYRKEYSTEPADFATGGFSDCFYYLTCMHLYGRNFQRHINEMALVLPSGTYQFKQNSQMGYFQNEKLYLFGFENNTLTEIPW